jgi:hypothetical protein
MIVVKDAFQNQTVQPIPVYLTNASGEVSGNYAHLHFEDALGWVELEGQFDQSTFQGTISYDNKTHVSGGTPAAGVLGNFSIPTCQFFVCQ